MNKKALSILMAATALAGTAGLSADYVDERRRQREKEEGPPGYRNRGGGIPLPFRKRKTRGDHLLAELYSHSEREKVSARLKAEAEEKRRRKAEKLKKLAEKGTIRG